MGLWLAEWAADHLREQPALRVISRQQWAPELAEDLAQADSVLFLDSSAKLAAGSVDLIAVEPDARQAGLATHHLSASRLLGLCRELYPCCPDHALLLTIGMGSTALGGAFSPAVQAALPEAQALLEITALRLLKADPNQARSEPRSR